MTIEEHGGMTIPDGIDEVVDSLPSSIPPEMFHDDESVPPPPRMRSIPRLAVPRPLSAPTRVKTPPPLPLRAKTTAPAIETRAAMSPPAPKSCPSSFPAASRTLILDADHSPTPEPTPAASPRGSDRPTLSPEELAAYQPIYPASARVPLAPPSSMSAMMVPASSDSAENAATSPEDADDEIVPAGVPRPSKWKKLFVFAFAAAATFVVARKLETKAPRAVAAPPASPLIAPPVLIPSEPQPTAAPVASTTPTTTESAAATTATTSAVPSDRGSIDTASAMAGRRVFVDGHVVGQTPGAMLVKCGLRKVKVGSAGHTRKIDVPCGGSIAVGDF